MDQQPQKRLSVGDDGPQTKRIKTSGPETPAVYSDAVRRKLQSASRTGQACDRCKVHRTPCSSLSGIFVLISRPADRSARCDVMPIHRGVPLVNRRTCDASPRIE